MKNRSFGDDKEGKISDRGDSFLQEALGNLS